MGSLEELLLSDLQETVRGCSRGPSPGRAGRQGAAGLAALAGRVALAPWAPGIEFSCAPRCCLGWTAAAEACLHGERPLLARYAPPPSLPTPPQGVFDLAASVGIVQDGRLQGGGRPEGERVECRPLPPRAASHTLVPICGCEAAAPGQLHHTWVAVERRKPASQQRHLPPSLALQRHGRRRHSRRWGPRCLKKCCSSRPTMAWTLQSCTQVWECARKHRGHAPELAVGRPAAVSRAAAQMAISDCWRPLPMVWANALPPHSPTPTTLPPPYYRAAHPLPLGLPTPVLPFPRAANESVAACLRAAEAATVALRLTDLQLAQWSAGAAPEAGSLEGAPLHSPSTANGASAAVAAAAAEAAAGEVGSQDTPSGAAPPPAAAVLPKRKRAARGAAAAAAAAAASSAANETSLAIGGLSSVGGGGAGARKEPLGKASALRHFSLKVCEKVESKVRLFRGAESWVLCGAGKGEPLARAGTRCDAVVVLPARI